MFSQGGRMGYPAWKKLSMEINLLLGVELAMSLTTIGPVHRRKWYDMIWYDMIWYMIWYDIYVIEAFRNITISHIVSKIILSEVTWSLKYHERQMSKLP